MIWRSALQIWVALVLSTVVAGASQRENAYVGTWRLDVAATTSTGKKPIAGMLTISEVGDGRLRVHVQELLDASRESVWSFSFGKVGKRTPVRGVPEFDTVVTTAAGKRAGRCLFKKGETLVTEVATEVDPDATVLTITTKTLHSAGEPLLTRYVYRRHTS
jgi:hypothetical protein